MPVEHTEHDRESGLYSFFFAYNFRADATGHITYDVFMHTCLTKTRAKALETLEKSAKMTHDDAFWQKMKDSPLNTQ